jgi:hypothetical protein
VTIKTYLRYLSALVLLAYLLNRHVIKPQVLGKTEPKAVIVLVNSFPNLAEAIIGTLILTGMGMAIRKYSTNVINRVSDSTVYLVVSLVAGLYVVTQELNWHNFRGPNVFDRYDIFASLVGLVLVNRMLNRYGFTNDFEKEE